MGIEHEKVHEHIQHLEKTEDVESLRQLKSTLEATLARVEQKKLHYEQNLKNTTAENPVAVKQVENLGGTKAEMAERTAPVDEKIKNADTEKNKKIEEAGAISHVEYKRLIIGSPSSYAQQGTITNKGNDSGFSLDLDSGKVLPVKYEWEEMRKNQKVLSEAFDFNPEEISEASIEDLKFIPAQINLDQGSADKGKIMQRGKIIRIGETKQKNSENVSGKQPDKTEELKSQERVGGIGYTEYTKKFQYFDSGNKTSFASSDGSNAFSFNSQTGEVLPLKEGWRDIQANPYFYLNQKFRYDDDKVFSMPIEQLHFVPAKLNQKGEIIQKGEIYL